MLRLKGKLDNETYWRQVLTGDPFLTRLMFNNVNVYPFQGAEWTEGRVPTMAYLGSLGRYLTSNGNTQRVNTTMIMVATLRETLAPCIPTAFNLAQQQAQDLLVLSVKALMKYESLAIYTEATREDFLAEIGLLANAANAPGSIFHGKVSDQMFINPTAAMWPETNQAIDGYLLNPRAAMTILYYMANRALPRSLITGVQVISTIVVAIVKRGTVSAQFLQKVTDGVKDDLNKIISLNEDVIRTTYINYGTNIDDTNIQVVFNRWKDQIPAGALRLGLVVLQAAGGGLTSYLTIYEAIKLFPTFPWADISLRFPVEWERFVIALNAVGDNQYYGFKKDLGPAKSTNFKSLAWVGKELLIKGDGKGSLSRYMGWTSRIAHQDKITEMIDEFVRKLDEEITDDKVEEQARNENFLEVIEIIRGRND